MRTVAAAIIEQDGKFLIAKRKAGGVMGGKWEFPGGKIEHDESLEDGLKREIKEELDADIEIEDFFDDHVYHYEDGMIKFVAYTAKCSRGNFNLSEHDEVRWISDRELGNFDFVGNDRQAIRKLLYC